MNIWSFVWNDLSDTGSKIASDDPTKIITPDKVTASKLKFRRQFRTNAWSSADLAAELAGSNPMQRINERVTEWWNRDLNNITIATLNGVINSNVANNSGDMVYVCGVGYGGATTPTDDIDATMVLNAKQGMGDKADKLKVMIMHSVVYTNLQAQNLIDFIPNARGEIDFPRYLGYRVMVTDTVPVTTISAGNFAYTTYLSAEGILGWAEKPPAVPVETERYPGQGNGAGVEALFTRRQFALHPEGFDWLEASVTDEFPSNTELETAGNWVRKYPERKQVPFVAIISKNG